MADLSCSCPSGWEGSGLHQYCGRTWRCALSQLTPPCAKYSASDSSRQIPRRPASRSALTGRRSWSGVDPVSWARGRGGLIADRDVVLVVKTSVSAAASVPGLLRDDRRGGVVRRADSERLAAVPLRAGGTHIVYSGCSSCGRLGGQITPMAVERHAPLLPVPASPKWTPIRLAMWIPRKWHAVGISGKWWLAVARPVAKTAGMTLAWDVRLWCQS